MAVKLEKVHGPPGTQLESSSKENIPFLDENIPYLEGRRGGSESLNQKKLPYVDFTFPGLPCMLVRYIWQVMYKNINSKYQQDLVQCLIMFLDSLKLSSSTEVYGT